MKKLLLILLAYSLFLPAFAGESGAYYNQDRNGEGIIYQNNGTHELWYFFTYGEELCTTEPVVSPAISMEVCIHDGQRWFFGTGGLAYITLGLEYPEGIEGEVGKADLIGTYRLIRYGGGFSLFIERFGTVLDADDFLFSRAFDFPTLLFEASE